MSQNTLPEVREKKLEKLRFNLDVSGAVVALVMKREEQERIPEFEEMCATACAIQNVWLGMHELGLAGYWSTGNGTDSDPVRQHLGLEPNDRHLGWLYVGKTDVELPLPQNRKPLEDYVQWEL